MVEANTMEDSLQYVNLTNAEVDPAAGVGDSSLGPGAGGQGQKGDGVLYVDGGMVAGPSGEQYVTIIQDGQTYAIPAADYAAMMSQQGLEDGVSRDTTTNTAPVAANGGDHGTVSDKEVLEPPNKAPTSTSTAIAENPALPVSVPETPKTVSKSDLKSENINSNKTIAQNNGHKILSPTKAELTPVNANFKNVKITAASPGASRPQKIFTSDTSQRKHLYPTIQEVIQKLPEQSKPPRKNYKPIRVDNWGIFLLSRLQTYFQKKEYCDLTLRFPSKNAQIKVHKLILNACTDFFAQYEKDGKVKDNAVDMPANFTPEAVAPIIRFMYTGKIELKEASYEKLYETAETLQMGVLTKLMDAQVNAPDMEANGNGDKKTANKRKCGQNAFEEDPVEQIRKIRRIEKRVALEGKRALKQSELDGPRLPGKKLPIWKKKAGGEGQTLISNTSIPSKQSNDENLHSYKIPKVANASESVRDMMNETIEKCREEDDEQTHHIKIEPSSGQLLASPVVGTTYKRRSPGEKPKIPRRVQEIQQHLMFEKVLKSGTKNNIMKKGTNDDKSKEVSIDEVKELMEEQKQRLAAISQEDIEDENDEFDYNDDSVAMGDDYIDNVDSPAPESSVEEETSNTDLPSAATSVLAEPEPQKKTIRFNLKPKPDITVPAAAESLNYSAVTSKSVLLQSSSQFTPIVKTPNDTDSRPPVSASTPQELPIAKKTQIQVENVTNELDEALEEFSRVAEAEEAEELNKTEENPIDSQGPASANLKPENKTPAMDPKKPRRGRPPRWLKEQTLQMGVQARNTDKKIFVPPAGDSSIDLKKEDLTIASASHSTEQSVVKSEADENQSQLINEVFKKYPNLFKENKAVKIKILTKDASGKSVTKFITLKAQDDGKHMADHAPSRNESPIPVAVGGFKPVQKVMYTGKRGRPKKVKPGDFDPHHEERKKINAKLKRDYPQLASQLTTKVDNAEEAENPDDDLEPTPLGEDLDEVIQNETNTMDIASNMQQLEPVPQDSLQTVANEIAPGLGLSEAGQTGQLLVPDLPGTVPQFSGGQTFVMDTSQLHIVPGTSQLVSMNPAQQQQGELIQLLTSDGQVQFAMTKGKLAGSNLSIPQPLGLLNPQQGVINPPGVMGINTHRNISAAPQVVSVNNLVGLTTVGTMSTPGLVMSPGMMTYVNNTATSLPAAMIPVTTEMLQTPTFSSLPSDNNSDGPRVVHKIVSDWDSDEDGNSH